MNKNKKMLLVDLENVQKFDLRQVPSSVEVKVFVGLSQKNLPTDLVAQTQALGSRLKWVLIDGNGSNALDFHIACYLGEGLARNPETEFVILSRDKGFDPLIRHLAKRGLSCRRVETAAGIVGAAEPQAVVAKPAAAAEPDPRQKVLELLKGIDKNKRPRKRQTLINYVANHFRKKYSAEQVRQAIEQLVRGKQITDTNAAVSYNF